MFAAASVQVEAKDEMKIGVSIPSADHGWTGGVVWNAKKAIEEWGKKDPSIKFSLVTAANPAEQVGQVEDLMVKGIQCLVILPHDSAPLTPVCQKVKESGILLVVVDRGLSKSIADIYVAGDNPGLGRVSGEFMASQMKGEGDIVVLEGIPCVINTERVDAFKEVMKKYPKIKTLDSQPAYWSTQKGLEIMENYLQKFKKIDAVWAQDDDVLKGVLQAYKESGRKDIKFFLGGAGNKDVIKMVLDKNPLVPADVTYPPAMVKAAIEQAVTAVKAGAKPAGEGKGKKIIIPSELVTPENAKDYYVPESVF
ncbi:MAG: ABC transporter substrate-binding protein [bacterium]